jgi:hypothetical protein
MLNMEKKFDVELVKWRRWIERAADTPTEPVDIKYVRLLH